MTTPSRLELATVTSLPGPRAEIRESTRWPGTCFAVTHDRGLVRRAHPWISRLHSSGGAAGHPRCDERARARSQERSAPLAWRGVRGEPLCAPRLPGRG